MSQRPTRLNLDSSGRQVPPEEKKKPSSTYVMEKVGKD